MAIVLRKPKGATHKDKRLGIGNASGHGGTSTKGHKGAQSRKGYSKKIGFEGGQMPLTRRVPKKGFNNGLFKKVYQEVHLDRLNAFEDGASVSVNELYEKGIIKTLELPFKILNDGKVEKKVEIILRRIKRGRKFLNYDKISANAKKVIEEKGGKILFQ